MFLLLTTVALLSNSICIKGLKVKERSLNKNLRYAYKNRAFIIRFYPTTKICLLRHKAICTKPFYEWSFTHIHTKTYTHERTPARTHARTHTYIRIYMCIYIYIYTHIRIELQSIRYAVGYLLFHTRILGTKKGKTKFLKYAVQNIAKLTELLQP
jgi:hypothetical protein